MRIEPIELEFGTANSFPCFVCEEKTATLKAIVKYKGEDINLCLCPNCVKLPEETLVEKILERYAPQAMASDNEYSPLQCSA